MMLDTVLSAAAAGVFVRTASAGSQVGSAARQRIIVFDVNETLLDVGARAPQFQRLFGNSGVAQEWFSNVVLYSQAATIAGPYVDFGTIARAALDMTGAAHSVLLAPADRDAILRGLISLPPHADVRDGLQTLRAAGFRLVTHSAPTAVEQQLKNAGIGEYFERSFSVDAVRKFKPAAEVYHLVAMELQVAPVGCVNSICVE
jgi:2-haloacid dehalogenase